MAADGQWRLKGSCYGSPREERFGSKEEALVYHYLLYLGGSYDPPMAWYPYELIDLQGTVVMTGREMMDISMERDFAEIDAMRQESLVGEKAP